MENNSKIFAITDKIVRWGVYAFIFLFPLFFLPFNASILEVNKQLLLTVFAAVLLAVWLGRTIAQGRFEFKKSFLNVGVVLFLVFYLVGSLLSKNVYQAFVGFGGNIAESFSTVLSLAVMFFIVANTLKNKGEILHAVFALTLSGMLAGVLAILQLAGKFLLPWDFARAVSFNTVGSVNALEIFLAGLLALSSVLFVASGVGRARQIFYGVAAAFFLFMALSINFGNVWWALLLASMLTISLGIINREQMNQTRLILPMVVLAFAILMLLIKPTFFSWSSVPAEISPSFSATMDIDKAVLKDKLFFGSGPASFAYDYGLHRSAALNQTDFWNVRFNQGLSKIFSQPSTLGLAGSITWLILVVAFAVYGFWKLVRKRGEMWVLSLGLYSGWLVLAFLQFLYPTNLALENAFWVMLALSLLSLKILGGPSTALPQRTSLNETRDKSGQVGAEDEAAAAADSVVMTFERNSPLASILSFVFVVVLVLTISVLYLGGTYWWADVLYQRGLQAASKNSDLEGSSVAISRAVMLNPYNDLYLRTLSQAALLRVDQEFAKPQSKERDQRIQDFIATAVNLAKRSTELAPLNSDNWVQGAVIYRSVMPYLGGADQWAASFYQEATKLEPKNPFYYWELGRTYVLAADLLGPSVGQDKEKQVKVDNYLARAVDAFKESVAVKPDYASAVFDLAMAYERQGKTEEAIKGVVDAQAMRPTDVGVTFQLGLLYYKLADWANAKAQFERAVSLDANYANARYFLGLVDDRLGNKNAAIEQFQKVSDLNPDNQDVKNILANLKAGKPAITQMPQQPSNLPIGEKQPQEVPPQPGLNK